MAERGFILCVSGPSGSGKTSLCDRLAEEHSFVLRSISVTTRPQRPGENSGKDYIFVSRDEFLKMRVQGDFLETAEVFGNLYGTPRRPVEEALKDHEVIVMDIDTLGANTIKNEFQKDCVTVFILPPSMDELERRLMQRKQNTPEDLARRLKEAAREIAEAADYDYRLENHEFSQSYEQMKKIVFLERASKKP